METAGSRGGWWCRAVFGVLLAAVVVLPYLGTWSYPFLFDDEKGIVQNVGIRQLWPPQEVLGGAEPDTTPWGRPLLAYTLAVNHAVSGLAPWSYRMANVVLHGLNALLVVALVARLGLALGRTRRWAWGCGAMTALLWAAHPLTTNAVGYVIQRAESLVSFFHLATLVLVLEAARRREAGDAAWWRWLAAAVGICALGMLTKETMVTVPVAAAGLWWACFPGQWRGAARRGSALGAAAFAATWLVLAAVMLAWPRSQSVGTIDGFGPFESLLTQSEILTHYLRLAFWPHGLSFDYWWPARRSLVEVWPNLLLIGGLLAGAWVTGCRSRPLGWLALWPFLVLAPTSSVIPVLTQLAAEHRMYLPLAAIVALLVLAVDALARRARVPAPVLLTLGLAVTAALAVATTVRLRVFASQEQVWEDVLRNQPRHARAMTNLGHLRWKAGDRAAAEALFRQAIEVAPAYHAPYLYLGVALAAQRQYDEAEKLLLACVERVPAAAEAWVHLGSLAGVRGRRDEARRHFEHALSLAPNLAEAHFSMALWYAQGRDWEAALRHLDTVLWINPNDPDARRIRATIEQQMR